MAKIIELWQSYGPVYLGGLVGTLYLSFITILFSTLLGLIIALVRISKKRILTALSSAYIWVIRGTPILLQLYFFWLILPKILSSKITDQTCILMALTINASAFIAEVIRSGIQAVDQGQNEAGESLGMTRTHIFVKIILPQAFKNILPALGNEYIAIMKETSLASVFFVVELTTAYKTVQSATFLPIPSLTISGVIYLLLVALMSQLFRKVERRMAQ